ncbi:MAG: S8 family serine peptidase [Salinibacter sp.]
MKHRATTRRMVALAGLLLLLGLRGVGTTHAQSLSAEARTRLSPRLAAVATGALSGERLAALLSPVGAEPRSEAAPPRYGVFVHARTADALRAAAPAAHSVAEGLFTARLTPAGLRRVARTEAVRYVEAARTYAPLNDLVRAATGAHPLHEGTLGRAYTGEGVLACVIDTGIDWSHPAFRGPGGSSRIRALWDQTLASRSSERSPSGFGYGVAYTRSDIERALSNESSGAVRSMDTHGHGTHVAATLAGTGAATAARTHRGMAPEAGIVAVKTDRSGTGIADGLRYCRSVARSANQPVVASLSLGARGGPHDGSSPVARAVDAFTGPGRSVVVAAGNSGDANRHWSADLPAGGTDSLRIRVPPSPRREGPRNDVAFQLDTWIEGPGVPTALLTPGGERLPLAPDTAVAVRTPDGTVVYERATRPDGERRLELLVHDGTAGPPASGTWSVVVENAASGAAAVHAWMTETTTASRLPTGDAQSTLTVPATAHSALTVGAWTHRGRWQTPDGTNASIDSGRVGTVAPFSSRGPVRGGGRKPDLVAPGQWTVSARSRAAEPPPRRPVWGETYALRRGTSTAAAATAGAVALLLEANPSLPPARTAALLAETARPLGASEQAWTPRRGHGRLDVFRAMTRLRGTPAAARSGPADALPPPGGERSSHTLGGRGAQALSTRFTPAQSGAVDGLLLRTASGSANRLQDSLVVSIWTDDGGLPGRRLGAPVSIAPAALSNHTTNFVSLTGVEALVRADTSYHVVLRAPDGELDVAGRTKAEGRSWGRSNGTWSPLSSTLGLRVTTSFALDLTAPRLSAPAASAILEARRDPTLSWTAVPSAETYAVQVSASPQFAAARTDTFHTAATALQPSTLAPSTGYHWRVRAERLGYAGPWSDARAFLYYPATVDVRASQAFGAPDGSSQYHLVALPGRSSRALNRTVKGRSGSSWSAYRETGRAETGLVPLDGSSSFRFRPGAGVWLRSERPWRVRRSVPTVPLREDGTYAIELHDGWNIISNPFDLDVAWAAVDAANDGPLPPLWRFGGQFERTETFASARSGTAFYFLNDQGRDVLRVPYPAFPDAPAGSASTAAPPALTLRAVRAGTTRSQVRVGVHDDAADGRDRYDQVAPPSRFGNTTLRLAAPAGEAPPRQQQWAAEYRSSTTDGHTFSLTLRAAPGAPVELRAAGLDVFEGQEVVLVDPAAGETYDLRVASTVTIRPEEGPRSLRLLVGSSDYVKTKQRVALPSDLQFLPNYPNPFSDQTTLEYVLPSPATVRLAVYDVLGRQVRVLVDERQEAGRHTVRWDGHDESGRRMASGVYLARLTVGETTKVRKMTFVR